jgi:hypothetical protein
MRRILVLAVVVGISWFAWTWYRRTPQSGENDKPAVIPESARALTPKTKAMEDRDWGDFRIAYPYSIQVIAASSPYPDGTRTLLVSEPPPGVTVDEMKKVDQAALSVSEVKTHTVGHDGWVKDVVFNLPPGTTDDALKALAAGLCRTLYGTDYGSYYLPLPVNLESLHTKYPLDLHVGIDSLRKWFTQTPFKSTNGLTTSLDSAPGGNYLSVEPGVVAWVIPGSSDVAEQRAQIRHFCLDSDLIMGAANTANGSVTILGRERIVPVDVLPPLRTETVLLLAGAVTDELQQSYERTSFFAGRFSAGRFSDSWDWAPAYLSPQLVDTEYGTLLNIADQLLKSWTQHGETAYQNFPYPAPARYPFDQTLRLHLHTHGALLFNWNTKGVGFTAKDPGIEIYGLSRTGSLPVIYRPDSDVGDDISLIKGDAKKVRDAEDAGYNFFVSRNEPVLARVVQYAAIYQAFRAFGISTNADKGVPVPEAVRATVRDRLRSALTELVAADDTKVNQVARERATDDTATATDTESNPGMVAKILKELEIRDRADLYVKQFTALQAEVRSFVQNETDQGLDRACEVACLGNGDDIEALFQSWKTRNFNQSTVDFGSSLRGRAHVITAWSNVNDARMAFRNAWDANRRGWIHTQTIVVSRNFGSSAGSTGGHDLSAKVTRIVADADTPAGTLKLDESGHVIKINPKDVDAAGDLVRTAVHEAKDPQIESILAKRLADNLALGSQPDAVVLGLGDRDVRAARGFVQSDHVPSAQEGPPGPPREAGPPDLTPEPGADPPMGGGRGNGDGNIRGTGGGGGGGNDGYHPRGPDGFGGNDPIIAGLLIEKRADGRVVIYRGTGDKELVAEVWNAHDAHRAVLDELHAGGTEADKRPLVVEFGAGYEASDREAFLKSLSVQAERYPEGQGVVAIGPLSETAAARLHGALTEITPEPFKIDRPADGSQVVKGSLQVADLGNAKFRMTIEATYQPGVAAVSADAVNGAVADVAGLAADVKSSPLDLGLRVYSRLQQFSPGRRLKRGIITVPDAGDFTIVLEDESPAEPAPRQNEVIAALARLPGGSANP